MNLAWRYLLLVWGAGVIAIIACVAATLHLPAAYRAAVADAIVAEPSEISEHLMPISPRQRNTHWDNIQGEHYVLTVTWASWHGYTEKIDSFMQLEQEVWVTPAPQVREFCSGRTVKDLDLRLKQLLGLPPGARKTMFVEIWVKPSDLFRPCPDREIHDNRCELHFPEATPVGHKMWFNRRRATTYYGKNAYPWTRLGYTYDWGSSSGEVGLSEYVISKGATVKVRLVEATRTYCSGDG